MTHAYVKDVMTTDVVAVRADASYRDLAAQLGRTGSAAFLWWTTTEGSSAWCPNQTC